MRTQVHHIVAETARTRGDSPALTFKAATLTYGQLWQEIVGVAAGLRRLGLDRGERVAVYLDKRIETVAALFALLGDELAGCKSVEHIVLLDCDPDGVPQATQQVTSWDDLRAAAEPGDRAEPAVLDVDVAAILYTSGSTGKPKGVVLSHRNLIAGGESVSTYLGNAADDVILAALPLSFDAGFSQLTTGFTVGAQVRS